MLRKTTYCIWAQSCICRSLSGAEQFVAVVQLIISGRRPAARPQRRPSPSSRAMPRPGRTGRNSERSSSSSSCTGTEWAPHALVGTHNAWGGLDQGSTSRSSSCKGRSSAFIGGSSSYIGGRRSSCVDWSCLAKVRAHDATVEAHHS